MRILGLDPGQKNIGIAISDSTGSIANPLTVINHISRPIDAASIAQIAMENEASLIVVGQALNADGLPSVSGRRAARLAAAIRTQTDIQVVLWDESNSTQTARLTHARLKAPRSKRRGHLDELAATVILQSYLTSQAID